MAPIYRTAAVALVGVCLAATPAYAQRRPPATAPAAKRPAATAVGCPVEGVWELASVSVDGKERALSGYQQRKMLSRGRFMWIGQSARRDTITLRTVADTLRANQVLGGSGTYTVRGNAYTERLDYFFDPRGIGQTLSANCRVDGEWWYHSFTVPWDTTATRGPIQHIVELWRRVQ